MLAVVVAPAAMGRPARPRPPAELATIPIAMLTDLGSGRVLYARQPDRRFAPASVTKVMTAYVAFEELAAGRLTLRRRFTVSAATAREWNGRGTSMYLRPGEAVSTDDLLHGIMTASANDAAIALAEGYAGSVAAWTFMMNDASRRLGMSHSRFITPNGWPDGRRTYVSARDLVTLSSAMLTRHPALYQRYAGHRTFRWRQNTLGSHDPVTGVVAGADGIKTGYTREAGYNFLGSGERDGRRLVMVVAGARSAAERDTASRAFLEWGFSHWRALPLFGKGETVANAQVQNGDARSVPLVAVHRIYATLPAQAESKPRLMLAYRGPLVAPIKAGTRVAELRIAIDGMEPSHIPLYAARDVAVAGPLDRLINGLMNLVP
ncbi:MAG TPA: D-alanyl-D-alanine carboxypeptidase family protein [Novosphingobium sp.]|nr:D-alanyl-D-alanine carboxypeptidase family protein [Novosphingobium sp.]